MIEIDEERFKRFERRIEKTATCWIWRGSVMHKGYGQFNLTHSKNVRAHRLAYQIWVGEIPVGKHLDHLCRNRLCVNPAHLEPVTPRENVHRSPISPAHLNSKKTHCPSGHPYAGDNLFIRKNGIRECRACGRDERRRYLAKNRDVVNACRREKRAAAKRGF